VVGVSRADPLKDNRPLIAQIAIKYQFLMQLLAAIFPANIAPSAENSAARFDRPNL
jgi:hypothetical protein